MHFRMSRHSRVERTTTSCGECRRRKQRCNQGRPCSNCARRFPQPACEYRLTGRRQISPAQYLPQPSTVPSLSASYAEDAAFQLSGSFEPIPSLIHLAPLPSPWAGNPLHEGRDVARWSGIDLFTQFPASSSPETQWSLSWPSPAGTSAAPPVCFENSTIDSGQDHASMQLLQNDDSVRDLFLNPEWQQEDSSISPDSWFSIPSAQGPPGASPWPATNTSPFQGLLNLPALTPTQQNPDLLKIFLRTLAPFSAALDGNTESSNAYMKYYIPLCLQSPLMIHTAMYTAACFLNETNNSDKSVAMAHKSQAISMLNENLWSDAASSDETVAAHTQLILNEWYWGAGTDLRAHLRGLKDIIQLRGGVRSLGLHGLIAKMAITTDLAIALSYEIPPVLQPARHIEPLENTQIPLRLSLNTPLVSSLPRFADCAEALKLDPATAAILDDMRFLISAVLALPDNPTQKELQKINTTSAWIHNRTSSLPDYSPQQQRRPPLPNSKPRSSTTPAIIVTDNSTFDLSPEAEQSNLFSSRRGSWHSVHSTHSIASATSSRSDQAYSDRDRDSPIPILPPLTNPMPSPLSFHNHHHHQPSSTSPTPSTPDHDHDSSPPDPLYQSIRLTAILYSLAITTRQPFSRTIAPADFSSLWSSVWRVPLPRWKGVLGVFNWIIVALAAGATPADGQGGGGGERRRQTRFVRSMLANSLLQMGVDNWELTRGVMEGVGRLEVWLAGGSGSGDGNEEGEGHGL